MKINKHQLYDSVEKLRYLLLSAGVKYPFNIFDICSRYKDLEIETCPFKTKGLRGMAVIADESTDVNCILVNSHLSPEEQNFHGFHELIHIASSKNKNGQTFKCYDNVKPFQNSYEEWVANEGSAELIVPYKDLFPLIKEDYNNMLEGLGTFSFCSRIAPKFLVTPIVIQNRLNSLAYEIEQYINGCPLDRIEFLSKTQQKKENIFIKSLNDLEDERLAKSFKFLSPIA